MVCYNVLFRLGKVMVPLFILRNSIILNGR
jgi:hypothetical protein